MDIESIQIFLDVRRTGSITATAAEHYMTQPALGKRIALLEKELGVTLFNRGKGQSRVELTQAGKSFCDIATRMLMLYNQSMELKDDADKEYLTVASIRSAHDFLLPEMLLKLKKKHPNLCVSVEEHHTAEIIELLEKRRIDVGIIQKEAGSPNLVSRLLYEEPYRIVVKESSSLAGKEKVKPKELSPEHGIFQVFDSAYGQWFDHHWQPYSVKVRVNSTPTAERYFSENEDWMIVPEVVSSVMAEQGFVSIGIDDEVPLHRVYMCWNSDNQRKSLNWLKEFMSV